MRACLRPCMRMLVRVNAMLTRARARAREQRLPVQPITSTWRSDQLVLS